ncbi:MAG: hypothetical protein BGO55_01055 [Sphingobacteriales bacterium 50-39]|nr:MAG: hypothetical protein BGO55_01055 [Sphingobacteriales bacterium 50-39]
MKYGYVFSVKNPNMINRVFYIVLICLFGAGFQQMHAQTSISRSVLKSLQVQEDSLKVLSDSLINAGDPAVRLRADSQFIRTLVRSLKMKNSFYYPFDSLAGISRLYAPDSTFRILTWQYKRDDLLFLQEGAIQMNQPDGSLKLYPLFDVSMFTAKPLDSIRTRRNWIGAIYYRIIEKSYQGTNYYTLLGFDDFTRSSNKKWMEVLTFSRSGEPVFGGPYFSFQDDSIRKPVQYRYNIEYKKDATTRFNYDPQLNMVLFDHLVPEGDEPERKDTYIPDGDFEGFKWQDGMWVHVEKRIFNTILKNGEFPMDEKMRDDNGAINEQKLQEQSEKNIQNAEKAKTTTPAKKPVKKPNG